MYVLREARDENPFEDTYVFWTVIFRALNDRYLKYDRNHDRRLKFNYNFICTR